MHNTKKGVRILAGALLMAGASLPAMAVDMTFFITSTGPGNGANLGGLEGADRHCQTLAAAAGAGKRTWRAYLSTQAAALNDTKVVHARDRIGTGPWFNAKGVLIARNVDELHSPHSNLTKATLVDEKGQMVNGRTEKPNRHDILTGSRPDGTAFPPSPPFDDMTCGNWTKGGEEGTAMTGHHDRSGPTGDAWATSWNSAHPTRGGCSQKALQSTGGDGLLYCFAER
ncbi:hypothetical protein LLG90_23990 [Aromatoleum toluclasticum]|uniref:hypothetical protein n=1 Tax=Aromatoleum toluclasticum TaxID=92003 RepID=UPI001D1935CD|nr:hypothetical protein [Aromatoleum toluclasticum]MCC4118422.1 hypothetical protein [Aromatoleum toluclasticum]